MRGSIIIAIVITPESRVKLQPSVITNTMYPKSPYTMDGIPERVSAVTLMIFTNLLPLLEYSTRYIAANTPIGTASISVRTIIITVLIMAGIMDWFSAVNFQENSPGIVRLGTP